MSQVLTLSTKRMHHIVTIIIIAMLTVLFCNVTHYTNSLLSCVHDNSTNLLTIMCTLVAIDVILGKLECTNI